MCLGLPGKVVEIDRDADLGLVEGRVDFDGIVKRVNLSFTPDVEVGHYVIVHVGFSISQVDEESARETMQYLREIGGIEEELGGTPGAEAAS